VTSSAILLARKCARNWQRRVSHCNGERCSSWPDAVNRQIPPSYRHLRRNEQSGRMA
jgi:hypothetical protein